MKSHKTEGKPCGHLTQTTRYVGSEEYLHEQMDQPYYTSFPNKTEKDGEVPPGEDGTFHKN